MTLNSEKALAPKTTAFHDRLFGYILLIDGGLIGGSVSGIVIFFFLNSMNYLFSSNPTVIPINPIIMGIIVMIWEFLPLYGIIQSLRDVGPINLTTMTKKELKFKAVFIILGYIPSVSLVTLLQLYFLVGWGNYMVKLFYQTKIVVWPGVYDPIIAVGGVGAQYYNYFFTSTH